MSQNKAQDDKNTLPFDHAQTTMMLHSTALTRMAADKKLSYDAALDLATVMLREAAIRARILLERKPFAEEELQNHNETLDGLLISVKGRARQLIGAPAEG